MSAIKLAKLLPIIRKSFSAYFDDSFDLVEKTV